MVCIRSVSDTSDLGLICPLDTSVLGLKCPTIFAWVRIDFGRGSEVSWVQSVW